MQLFNLLKKPFDWLRLAEPRVLNQQLTELFKTSDIPTVSVCIGIPILSFVLLDPDKPVQMTLWSLLLIASKVIGWWIIKQYKMQMPWLNNTSPKIFSLMLLMWSLVLFYLHRGHLCVLRRLAHTCPILTGEDLLSGVRQSIRFRLCLNLLRKLVVF